MFCQPKKISEIVDYRKKLLAQFEKSQVEYLQRKKERGHTTLTAKKLKQTLKSFSKSEDLETENPPQPDFIEARHLHKLGKLQNCLVLKRLFVIDNDKFIQYKNENSSHPTQKLSIAQSKAKLEFQTVERKNSKSKWTDTSASFRVCITLVNKIKKNKRDVYVYSNDLHELKALIVKIKYAGSAGLRNELGISMLKLSLVYNILQFEVMWKDLLEIFRRRNNRLVSFQMTSSRLIDVAGYQWQRSRLALQNVEKFILDKMEFNRIERQKRIMNVGGQLKIKSSLKMGRARPGSREGQDFQISSIINLRVEKLINLFRTRRSRRDPQVQLEVDYLRNLHLKGYPATQVIIAKNDKHGKLMDVKNIDDSNARIYFQGENIIIENLDNKKLQKSFLSDHQITHIIPLAEVSLITTDLIHDVHRQSDMDNQREYTIVLYGLFLNQTLKSTEITNVLAEHCKFTQLRHQSSQWYRIQIREIQLPLRFVIKFNNKGFLRVRLNQMWSSSQPAKFYVTSEEIFLSVPQDLLRQNTERVIIKTNGMDFLVDKLLDSPNERFTLSVYFAQSVAPIHSALRDYILLTESKFIWDKIQCEPLTYQESKNSWEQLELKSNIQPSSTIIFYNINKHSSTNTSDQLDFREGLRLLVGRFCLYDPNNRCQVCQVVQCNGDRTVLLRSVATHEMVGKRVPISKIKLIERYGVSVYDQNNLPQELLQAKFTQLVTIKTQNKRLLNIIQQAIQEQQVALKNRKIEMSEQIYTASGRLYISILHAQNLKNSLALKNIQFNQVLRPYVRISQIQDDKEVQNTALVSEIIEKDENFDDEEDKACDPGVQATWINQRHPLGQIFDIGIFQKRIPAVQSSLGSFAKSLKIEVYHAQKTSDHLLLGFCYLNCERLIDLNNLAFEQSIMLQCDGRKSGILTLQSRFVPDWRTQNVFHIVEESNRLKAPEAYIHFKSLLMTDLVDRFNYKVPLGNFSIRENQYMSHMDQVINKIRPLVLKPINLYDRAVRQIEQLQSIDRAAGRINTNETSQHNRDKYDKDAFEQAVKKMIYMSQEELRDAEAWGRNAKRPVRQEFSYNHINLWWAYKAHSQLDAKLQQGDSIWTEFMERIRFQSKSIKDYLKDDQLKQDTTTYSLIEKIKIDKELCISLQEDDTQPSLYNKDLNGLIYRGIWEQKKDVNYSDLYFLIHQVGIPDTKMRSRVWRELLKAQLSELESISHFKRCFGEKLYNPGLTIFQNYLAYCESFDCLAFDQIDEDVETYEFPESYLSNLTFQERQAKQFRERTSLRHVLRVLVVWARQRKVDGNDLCLSYSRGMLDFIQRLLSISETNAENAFWIVSGLVQIYPRPFSVPESVMEADCFSMLRAEMITFKALLEYNLPQVLNKLKQFGLTVEALVYKQILSFHANFFDSDIVLRLWDIMFLSFTTSDQLKQKIGLWYIFAPSYLVLREKQMQILSALTCEEIIEAYNNGCCLTYDPAKFIKDVDIVCEQLFVEQTVSQFGKGVLNYFSGSKIEAQNQKARLYDEKREQLQKDVSKLFKVVQLENKHLSQFLQPQQPFKEQQLREKVLKTITELTHFETLSQFQHEKSSQEIELPLHTVHVFVHGLNRMPLQQPAYTVKVTLGSIPSKSLIFKEANQKMNRNSELANTMSAKKVLETESVSNYYRFDYQPGSNYIKIELFEATHTGKRISDAVVNLEEFEFDRFIQRRILLRNSQILEVTNNYMQSFTQISISLFLQQRQTKENEFQKILSTFNRKLPDVVDIFEQTKNENLSKKFSQLVLQDYRDLDVFLPEKICQQIINDFYNYVEIEGFGNITMEEFTKLAQKILPLELTQSEMLVKVFQGMTGKLLSPEDAREILRNQLRNFQRTPSLVSNKNNSQSANLIGSDLQKTSLNQSNQSHFSLRQFLITTVMMSHSTVRQKLEIIFSVYQQLTNPLNEGLQLSKVIELISSVFTRSMYFIPDHELMNLVESLFCNRIGMIIKAYWTRDVKKIMDKISGQDITLENFLAVNGKVDLEKEGTSIDITNEVQRSFMNYVAIFGTKVIDFNKNDSPFKYFTDLVGNGASTILKITKEKGYKLVLFCQDYSERFTFDVNYSEKGELLYAGKTDTTPSKISDIESYFEKNSSRLFLNGVTKPITKPEFFEKIERIPMFANLLRVETFFRDRQQDMSKRVGLGTQVVVICTLDSCQLRFEFQSNILEEYEEGSLFEIQYAPHVTYTIKMQNVFESSLLGDIRQRIVSALQLMLTKCSTRNHLPNIQQLKLEIQGNRVWQSLDNKEWKTHRDWSRVKVLNASSQNLILLKLQPASCVTKLQDPYDINKMYDCFSLYRNSDQSYQWRPCRIVRRDLLPNFKNADIQHASQSFEYWIEFEHAKHEGKNMWFKRQSSEILFSKEYTRYHMRSFKRETLNYLLKLYK